MWYRKDPFLKPRKKCILWCKDQFIAHKDVIHLFWDTISMQVCPEFVLNCVLPLQGSWWKLLSCFCYSLCVMEKKCRRARSCLFVLICTQRLLHFLHFLYRFCKNTQNIYMCKFWLLYLLWLIRKKQKMDFFYFSKERGSQLMLHCA